MSIYVEIGERVIELRKEKGYTQERLALESEISVSYLRRIEHGAANPTIGELMKITEVLGVELWDLIPVPAAKEDLRVPVFAN